MADVSSAKNWMSAMDRTSADHTLCSTKFLIGFLYAMYVVKHIPSIKKVCHHAGQSYNIKKYE